MRGEAQALEVLGGQLVTSGVCRLSGGLEAAGDVAGVCHFFREGSFLLHVADDDESLALNAAIAELVDAKNRLIR